MLGTSGIILNDLLCVQSQTDTLSVTKNSDQTIAETSSHENSSKPDLINFSAESDSSTNQTA